MKPIVLTEEAKKNALEIFKKMLNETTDGDLKINITTETLLLKQGIEKPTVFITTTAYNKMLALINSSDKELAWHGTVSRVLHNYLIEDIFVYPQTVTAATVDADEEKYAKWLMELDDDVINNLRFQGHSHVNMSASPSGRDTTNWQKFANILKPGEFYILCIGNKRNEFYWNIYDTACNVYFENKDIEYCVIDEKGNSIKAWASDCIDKYITTQSFTMPSTTPRAGFNKTASNEHTPVKSSLHWLPDIPDTKTRVALEAIPEDFKGIIEYESVSDIYYTEDPTLPGFYFNTLYGCYTIAGYKFREMYESRNKHTKGKVGRPKKNK